MNKTKKIVLGLAAVAMAVMVAGCGHGTEGEAEKVGSDNGNFKRIEITVKGDQTVKCIQYYSGYHGGLSCNWEEYNEKYHDAD